MIGSDEGIKLGSFDRKALDTILSNVAGITLAIDVGTELGYLYGSFDCSIKRNIESLVLGNSLGYTDG